MYNKAKKRFAMRSRREGISIIEVLTSLAVATIGVFGVLVLIPFAVRQAQIGLDQDAADLVGRNAIEDLQTYGYTAVSDDGQLALRGSKVLVTGRNPNGTPSDRSDDTVTVMPVTDAEVLGSVTPNIAPNFYPSQGLELNSGLNARYPRVIHFDPVAVAAVGFPTAANMQNPDFLTGDLPPAASENESRNDLRVTLATGICPGSDGFAPPTQAGGGRTVTFNLLLDQAEVNRIFRTEDDLIISERNFLLPQTADDAVARSGVDLPQPVFDVSSQGNLMKRQSAGRISWSAIYVPVKDSNRVKSNAVAPPTVATKYKVYVLVYKDRSVVPGDPEGLMLSALVNRHTAAAEASGNPPVTTNGGFTPSVDQIHLGTSSQGVFKDDWVMLINRKPAPDYGNVNNLGLTIMNSDLGRRLDAEEAGYDVQLGFAKVLGVHSRATPVDGTVTTLTVDGGPFDFYYTDIQGAAYGAGVGEDVFSTDTYVIHLNNVINVYERTISLERNSVWN